MRAQSRGFTLMEMLIVVTIIGILAAIVLPRFIQTSGSAKKSAHIAERQTINNAMEQYNFQHSAFPVASGNALSTWDQDNVASYFPEGVPITCNQGITWIVTNGRVDESTHSGHE